MARERRRRRPGRPGITRLPARQVATQAEIEARAREEGPGILGGLGEALAVPGDITRGVLEQILDFIDAERDVPFQRRTARKFLEEVVGVTPPEFDIGDPLSTGTLGGAAVLATDILTDPLSLITGFGQLAKGTAAAAKAQRAARVGKEVGRLGGRLEAPLSAQAARRAPLPTAAPVRPGAEQLPSVEDLIRGLGPEDLSGLDVQDILRELPREVTAFGLPRAKVAEFSREQLERAGELSAKAKKAGFDLPTTPVLPRPTVGPVKPAIAALTTTPRAPGQRETLKALLEAPTIGELPKGLKGVFKELGEQFQPQVRPFELSDVGEAGQKLLASVPTNTNAAVRNLIQIGFGGKRLRVGLPGRFGQKIEARIAQVVGTPIVLAGRLIALPFKKIIAKSPAAADAARLLRGLVSARVVARGKEFAKKQEDLIVKNISDNIILTGNPPDEIADVIRQEFFTDITNARQLGTKRVQEIYGEQAALFVRDLNQMVDQATASQFARGARNDSLITDYAERILTPAGRLALKEKGKSAEYRSFLVEQANLWENSQFSRRDYTRDALNTDADRFFREQLGLTDGIDAIDLGKVDPLLSEDFGTILEPAFKEIDDILAGVRAAPTEIGTADLFSNLSIIKNGMALSDQKFSAAYLKHLIQNRGMELPEAMTEVRNLAGGGVIDTADLPNTVAFLQNRLLPADVNSKFFNLNPAETVARTVRERSMTVINAELAQSFVKDLTNIPGKAGDMPVGKFINAVGLRRLGNQSFKSGDLPAINRALENVGISSAATLPAEAAAEFIQVYGKFEKLSPTKFRKFVEEIWDPLSSVFRIGATAPLPFTAFHVRNFLSNIMLNYMGGVTAGKHYIDAFKQFFSTNEAAAKWAGVKFDPVRAELYTGLGLTKGGQLGQITDAASQELLQRQVIQDPEALGALAGQVGRFRGTGADVIEKGLDKTAAAVNVTLQLARQNPLSRWGFGLGTFVEDTSRIAHFLAKKQKRFTNIEAMASVNKFLFDYSNEALNGLEKGLFNRLFFFYRWQRFALPLVVNTFLEDPRRAAILLKATVQPGVERPAGIPEFIREAAGIPAGPVDPETGEQPFISRFGSPFEVLGALDPTVAGGGITQFGPFGGFVKLGRELFQQSVPLIRGLAEFISQQDFFLGRELAELDKAGSLQALIGSGLAGLTGVEGFKGFGQEVPRPRGEGQRFRTRPDIRFLLRNLPISRFTQTTSRLAELIGRPLGEATGLPISPTQIGEAAGVFEPGAERREKSTTEEFLRTVLGISLADVDVAEEAKRRAQRVAGAELEEAQLRGEVGQLPIFLPTEKARQAPGREVLDLLDEFRRISESTPQLPQLPQLPQRSRLGAVRR